MMAAAQPAERRILGRHGDMPKAQARYVGSPPRQAPEEAALRQFVDSRYQSKRDIALLLVLRSWRGMAAASQLRREELVGMWRDAFVFRQQSLVRKTLHVWRGATARRMQSADYRYEQAQLKLAVMHHRQLVLRNVIDRLTQASDLQLRLELWHSEKDHKLLDRCWGEWHAQSVRHRICALTEAATAVGRRSEQRLLAGAVGQWRARAHQPVAIESAVSEQHQARLLRECLRVWHMQAVAGRFAQSRHTSPVKATLTRWRDTAGEQRRQRALEAEALVVQMRQQNVLVRWRERLAAVYATAQSADGFYQATLVQSALDRLYFVVDQRAQNRLKAERYFRYTKLALVVTTLRRRISERLSGVLQSRALRDWERERNRKQRHVLLIAWHTIATDGRRNEQRAELFLARGSSVLVRQCVAHWLDECHRRAPNTGAHTRADAPTAHADAQTMTSFLGGPLDRSRTASTQSNLQGERPGSSERRELLLRVHRAEDDAMRARALLAGSRDTLLARAAQDEQLEALAEQWQRNSRGRLLRASLARLDNAAMQAQHEREQHNTQLDDMAELVSKRNLRKALRAWRSTTQLHARQCAYADELYTDQTTLPNRELGTSVLRRWRARLKEVQQLHMAATKRCAVRAARKFMDVMHMRKAETAQSLREADQLYQSLLLGQVWARIVEHTGQCLADRSRRTMLPSDQDALQVLDVGAPPAEYDQAELAADLGQIDNDELRLYFEAWLDVVRDMQFLQGTITEQLPRCLQSRALSAPGSFEWELLHQKHLLHGCITRWRGLVGTRPVLGQAADSDCDPWRAAQLQAIEQRVRTSAERSTAKQVLRRWMAVQRGQLLENRQFSGTMARVVAAVAARVRLVAEARRWERERVLRAAVRHWWGQYYVLGSRMENAAVQANGTLTRACMLRWVGRIKNRRQQTRSQRLYTKAVAFRWEKQARRALTRWMGRSSDCRIRARLAQRAGDQRESQLQAVADQWRRERMARSALAQLRSAARLHAVQQKMLLRFAVAWGNANIQRHALAAWRTCASPPGSMFFSVVGGSN
ncbi:hypothetical protein LPJ61_003659 [Coemansia biformis]|uniref:Sfi1 spindle body domain-containing protein n=1 Tax=Coemansia biformis TaxID=1286918 RepID=A0A9W7YBR4_9FUNG|nr:hypothetical protein LPJ61_003659 [Coemansia biformis]